MNISPIICFMRQRTISHIVITGPHILLIIISFQGNFLQILSFISQPQDYSFWIKPKSLIADFRKSFKSPKSFGEATVRAQDATVFFFPLHYWICNGTLHYSPMKKYIDYTRWSGLIDYSCYQDKFSIVTEALQHGFCL